MKRNATFAIAGIVTALLLTGCGSNVPVPTRPETQPPATQAAQAETGAVPTVNTEAATQSKEENTMQLTVNGYTFTVILDENKTARALSERLPLELDMQELNGNEKYNYLPFSLPTDTYYPSQIETGDVMLYGDSCLVVFYKSFSTPYSYTRIGHIDDVTDLVRAVGSGNVQMIFE